MFIFPYDDYGFIVPVVLWLAVNVWIVILWYNKWRVCGLKKIDQILLQMNIVEFFALTASVFNDYSFCTSVTSLRRFKKYLCVSIFPFALSCSRFMVECYFVIASLDKYYSIVLPFKTNWITEQPLWKIFLINLTISAIGAVPAAIPFETCEGESVATEDSFSHDKSHGYFTFLLIWNIVIMSVIPVAIEIYLGVRIITVIHRMSKESPSNIKFSPIKPTCFIVLSIVLRIALVGPLTIESLNSMLKSSSAIYCSSGTYLSVSGWYSLCSPIHSILFWFINKSKLSCT
uniref:G-protein coupled receptors family 1 profile domain-containing protein n=1 Tax=Tetranychus urticae TaxID=32264 RepID=T1K393_TETUR